ncbi:37S ribosomal protein Mrp17p, mitochondrial [[Candida] railenensis]|uniref:Small ribosomal subunit protein bS6m n=1 Tax=[Candida] railenensis TaxID=45579 RepID=A0A9P0QJY1_9ASCO|nr:37S ribosomal protein Mrp17p, mitochondrial [[Candida] railenensis]
MFYELMAIARISDPLKSNKEAVKIVSTVGKLILANRGIIRSITNMGAKNLPKILKKEQEKHFQGHYFMMGFDCSTKVQQELLRTLLRDPRILRANIMRNKTEKNLNTGVSFERAYKSTPRE